MKYVATPDKAPLTIHREGQGRLYEAVDDPKDIVHEKHGTWHVKAGSRDIVE